MKKWSFFAAIIMLIFTAALTSCKSSDKITKFTVDKTSLSIEVGNSEKLNVMSDSSNGENSEVLWTSSDDKVASVDSKGVVSALLPGSVKITVSSKDGKTAASCSVTVQAKSVKGVKLNKGTLSMEASGKEKLLYTIEPADAGNLKVAWSTSNSKVVSVDEGGTVTAVSPGIADITVKTEDGGYLAKCTVTVKAKAAASTTSSAPKTDTNTTANTATKTTTSSSSTTTGTTTYIDPGNVSSNSSNLGLAATYGGWIYYRSGVDNASLYRMKADGSQKTKVFNGGVMYVNIVNGRIYYTNGATNSPVMVGGCYEKPITDRNSYLVSSEGIPFVTSISKTVYYGTLGGLKVDGDGFLASKTIIGNGKNFYIKSGMAYYIMPNIYGGQLYRAKLDGSGATLLVNSNIINYSIDNDKIYYINSDDEKIYSCNLDGSGQKVVSTDAASQINVHNGWIYYADKSDGKKLYKMKTDGSGKVMLVNNGIEYINIVGNWVFYMKEQSAYSTDPAVYMIRTDGTKNQKA